MPIPEDPMASRPRFVFQRIDHAER
jgi:hypothetical protein